MNKIMNWLMLSCKKATELIEKKSLVGLSWKENVRLRMHTTMCDGCTAYQKQSLLIDKLLQKHITEPASTIITEVDSGDLKGRIISNLPKE